jgi:hypothetical protein
MPVFSIGHKFEDWLSEPSLPNEIKLPTFNIPTITPPATKKEVIEVGKKLFVMAADARYYTQQKTADFAKYWHVEIASPIAEDFGPAAGGVVSMFGVIPFAVITVLPYSNPWTIGPAIALDVYNIRKHGLPLFS